MMKALRTDNYRTPRNPLITRRVSGWPRGGQRPAGRSCDLRFSASLGASLWSTPAGVEPQEIGELLNLRYSTILDLSRRRILPAFKIGKHRRYRRDDRGADDQQGDAA